MSTAATVSRPRAQDVHRRIVRALADLDRAEATLVIAFGLMLGRHLYRKLGYSSIYQYAERELAFSQSKTAQLVRIGKELERLPRLRKAVESGDLPWTKARLVASIATPESEAAWIEEARRSGRRHLEHRVKNARRAFRDSVCTSGLEAGPTPSDAGTALPTALPSRLSIPEASVDPIAASPANSPGRTPPPPQPIRGENPDPSRRAVGDLFGDPVSPPMPVETPVTISLRLSPAQYARHERLVRTLRHRDDLGERYLDALAALAREEKARRSGRESPAPDPEPPHRVGAEPAYQIVVYRCESCGRGHVPTTRGDLPVDPAVLRQAACDGRTPRGERNVAVIPPSLRRRILERDGHRCRGAGCGRTGFLEVHHRTPRSRGGDNRPENLITLCSGCHRRTHARESTG